MKAEKATQISSKDSSLEFHAAKTSSWSRIVTRGQTLTKLISSYDNLWFESA
jgi:hypothetical protein